MSGKRQAAADPDTEALYDEVERTERGWRHSFLFWPKHEAAIELERFHFSTSLRGFSPLDRKRER
jgi:hypothetical protein